MASLDDKITELLNKGQLNHEEKSWLLKYLEGSNDEHLRNALERKFEAEKNILEPLEGETSQRILQNIHERLGVVSGRGKTAIIRMWVARIAVASVTGLLLIAGYSVWKKDGKPGIVKRTKSDSNIKRQIIQPGKNKALLTLADGSTITLDDQQNGQLARQGNAKVLKLNGKLLYQSANNNSNEILYNTIATPAGGQYQIELPDGSLVWLNAGSSLHFPTTFRGKERRVEVTGEAYFEVARNAAMPFKVKVHEAEVQVLGTGFNIMAYADEAALKTTLLHGEVKFVIGNVNKLLKPGQQTQLLQTGQVKVVSGIDVDEVVAWKNGMFDFEGADIASVARRLSRWYDVEMLFDKNVDDLFYAKIPTNTNLKDVLKALELTGKVRFVIDGRKIIAKRHS